MIRELAPNDCIGSDDAPLAKNRTRLNARTYANKTILANPGWPSGGGLM